MEEDGSVHEHVDLPTRLGEEIDEGGHRQVGPLVVQRDEFKTDGPGRSRLPELGPQGEHVPSQRLGGPESGAAARRAPEIKPTLNGFGIYLDDAGEVCVSPFSGGHDST